MRTLISVQMQRMPLGNRWFHLRYDLHKIWTDELPMWIAWRLPRRVVLWAFVRVAAASGKGPSELTYESMHQYWEQAS